MSRTEKPLNEYKRALEDPSREFPFLFPFHHSSLTLRTISSYKQKPCFGKQTSHQPRLTQTTDCTWGLYHHVIYSLSLTSYTASPSPRHFGLTSKLHHVALFIRPPILLPDHFSPNCHAVQIPTLLICSSWRLRLLTARSC